MKPCRGCKLSPCASWCSRSKPREVDGHSPEHEALRTAVRDEAIEKLREEYRRRQLEQEDFLP